MFFIFNGLFDFWQLSYLPHFTSRSIRKQTVKNDIFFLFLTNFLFQTVMKLDYDIFANLWKTIVYQLWPYFIVIWYFTDYIYKFFLIRRMPPHRGIYLIFIYPSTSGYIPIDCLLCDFYDVLYICWLYYILFAWYG